MKNISILAFASLLLFAFSCERKPDNKSESSAKETKTETVKSEVMLLKDSTDAAYKKMIDVDDQKFKDIKRLLDEISYTSDYDVALHDSLVKQLAVVKSKRFTETLDTAEIDYYDNLTDAYILKIYQLKSKSREIGQHPLADELVEDINNANSMQTVATLRYHYALWAKKYNEYLRQHRKKLEKLGEPYASLKERPELMQ